MTVLGFGRGIGVLGARRRHLTPYSGERMIHRRRRKEDYLSRLSILYKVFRKLDSSEK